MLHQLVILMCFHNKILLYVCVRMYCGVTLCNLWHEHYVNDMLLLFYCIAACCNFLSLIIFLPLFCDSKFYVNRSNSIQTTTITVQSTTTGRELRLKTTIPACLQPLERWSSQVCFTLRKATVWGNVELKEWRGEGRWEDNIKMNFGQ